MFLKSVVGLAACCAAAMLLGGCGTAQKTSPHMSFGDMEMKADLQRSDIVVLDRVEGTSTCQTIFFGVVKIIDGDKLQLFGIKFFKDKYTYFKQGPIESPFVQVVDRAYYKALEQHPDADAVFQKSMDHETEGIPLLCEKESVTFKGKAVKIKADPKAAEAKVAEPKGN